jgi:sodium-dependent phosphate transporter
MGPALFFRPAAEQGEVAKVPNYAVVQDEDDNTTDSNELPLPASAMTKTGPQYEYDQDSEEKLANVSFPASPRLRAPLAEAELTYEQRVAANTEKFHGRLRQKKGPLGWAMRTLHANPMGAGAIYERHNMAILAKRLPAMVVCGALYGMNYDIHAAQSGISGTPEGDRMERVYSHARKYSNEVEHTYSFVQVLTACTASFAHGANDIGNSVGPWAVIYSAWSTGDAAKSKAPVPIWQLAVLSATISIGLITYGYNIMKGKSQVSLGSCTR